MGWLVEAQTWFGRHPKVSRAAHTFWQATLASFLGSLAMFMPVLAQYDPTTLDAGLVWSAVFGAFCGAIGAGLSALKSLTLGVPEE
jgi:hypothetical protein